EGAHRFIRNEGVSPSALGRSSHDACIARCSDGGVFLVALDQGAIGGWSAARTSIVTKQATKQSKWEVGQQMNAGEFVLLVANLGGYTGKAIRWPTWLDRHQTRP